MQNCLHYHIVASADQVEQELQQAAHRLGRRGLDPDLRVDD